MDFGIKSIQIVFILLSFYISRTKGLNVDCNGKAFHCINTTHFKICVDLGGGVSKTVDDFLLPCPINTYCRPTNKYECEYYETTTTTTTTAASEINVIDDFEASVIPLISTDEKLNSTPDKNIPAPDLATGSNFSFVPEMQVTSPSYFAADNQTKNITKNVNMTTTHIIEDVNKTKLSNQTAFETMKDEIKYIKNINSSDLSVDELNAITNNYDLTTNIPITEQSNLPTESFTTMINIHNTSVKAKLPTMVSSYIQNSKNNKTSYSLEVKHTLYDTNPNNTFVTNNITSKMNPIFYTNKSDVLEQDTDVFIKNDKKIELANIILTPANTQENLKDLTNETIELSLIGNDTPVNVNFTFSNKIMEIQNLVTLVSNVSDNINSEITTMTPIEDVITPNFSIPISIIEKTQQNTVSTDLSTVPNFENNQKNSTQIFYDGNNSSSILKPQTENVKANTSESHEPVWSNRTSTTNINFTAENNINMEILQNDTEKHLCNKPDHKNNTKDGLIESTINIEQNHNYVSQQVTAKLPTKEILNKTYNSTSSMEFTNIIKNKDKEQTLNTTSDSLSSGQRNLTLTKDFVRFQHLSTQLPNRADHINIETAPMPSSTDTSNFSSLITTTASYEQTSSKQYLSNAIEYQNTLENSTNVFSEMNNTKTSLTESDEPKLLSNFTFTTNIITTTENYDNNQLLQNDMEKYLDDDIAYSNNSVGGLQETTIQTEPNHSVPEEKENLNLIFNNIPNMGLINKTTNKNDTQSLVINSNDTSISKINKTLINNILSKRPATSVLNDTENINVRFTPTPSFEDINGFNFSLPLSTTKKFQVTTKRTNLSHVTEFENNLENSTIIFSDGKNLSSTLDSQVENSFINAPEKFESKLLSNLNFPKNVMVTTESYKNQLLQNDIEKHVVDGTTYGYIVEDFQEATIQTEPKYTNVYQQGTTNAEDDLRKGNLSENNNLNNNTFKKDSALNNLRSTFIISNSTISMPTTEKYQPKLFPNVNQMEIVHTGNISYTFTATNNNKTEVLYTSTENYNRTVSGKTNYKSEENILTSSRNLFPPSTEAYKTLTSLPILLNKNSDNSNTSNQINYTILVNGDLRTEYARTADPTFLDIKQNNSSHLSSTNTLSNQIRIVDEVRQQPSLLVTKTYMRHDETTMSPIVSPYILSNTSHQFEEIFNVPTEIPKMDSKMMDALAETSSTSTINNSNDSQQIIKDLQAQVTATLAILTTPKLLINSRIEDTAIRDSKTFETIKPTDTINKMLSINNPSLESKDNGGKRDFKLLDTVSRTNNPDENVNFFLIPNNLTLLLNNFETPIHNESNSILNKSTIPNQFNKNITYSSAQTFETKKDFKTNIVNETSKRVFIDEAKIGKNKIVNNFEPIVHTSLLDHQYEFNRSRKSEINGSNGHLTENGHQNLTIHNNSSNKPITNPSIITTHIELLPEILEKKYNNNQLYFTASNATDSNYDSNITTFKNMNSKSLAALILPRTIFNSTQHINNNQSKIMNTNITRNEHNVNVHINCLQKALDKDCHNLPTGKYVDIHDCKKFYLCLGEVHPYIGECPNGTVFSESKKQCTKNLSQCYRNDQFRCLSAGRYYDLRAKNVYYICVQKRNKFIKYKFQCQNGYTLNKTVIQCIKDPLNISSVNSRDSSSTKDESTSISIESSSKVETKDSDYSDDNDNEFECKKEGKFPYPNDCNKYYLCSKTKKLVFRRRLKNCDSGEIFDKEKQKCIEIDSRECK